MAKYILGIDEGTTSVRAGLYNIETNVLQFKSQKEIDIFCPHDGWVEQDGEKIFQAVKYVIQSVIFENSINTNDILSVSITNQRETTVAWNKQTGESVYPVINWQCRRTSKMIESLSQEQKDYLKNTTGLTPDAYFSASKMAWLLQNNKRVQNLYNQNNLAFGTIESFLIYRLTNCQSFVTDVTNASRTMLMDLKTCQWDDNCLNMFNIDKNCLGQIVSNDKIVGHLNINNTKIPICGVIGDQQSALVGQTCFNVGDVKNTYGTGCFVVMNTGENIAKSQNLVSTVGYKLKNKNTVYALEGSVFNAGSCVELMKDWQWFESPSETDTMVQEVEDSGKVVFVPALTGLGCPYWDMQARGMFIGITRATKKQHLVRAVLESIAFSCVDVLLEMKQFAKINSIKCDGGVSKNKFLMQFQSDISQTKLIIPKEFEKTLMGCIYMSMCGLGICDLDKLKQKYETAKIYNPEMEIQTIKRKYKRWKRAVIRSLEWVEE